MQIITPIITAFKPRPQPQTNAPVPFQQCEPPKQNIQTPFYAPNLTPLKADTIRFSGQTHSREYQASYAEKVFHHIQNDPRANQEDKTAALERYMLVTGQAKKSDKVASTSKQVLTGGGTLAGSTMGPVGGAVTGVLSAIAANPVGKLIGDLHHNHKLWDAETERDSHWLMIATLEGKRDISKGEDHCYNNDGVRIDIKYDPDKAQKAIDTYKWLYPKWQESYTRYSKKYDEFKNKDNLYGKKLWALNKRMLDERVPEALEYEELDQKLRKECYGVISDNTTFGPNPVEHPKED